MLRSTVIKNPATVRRYDTDVKAILIATIIALDNCARVTLYQQSVWRLSRIDAMQQQTMHIALIRLTGATGQNMKLLRNIILK